jgi:acetoin utilization protein AcuB
MLVRDVMQATVLTITPKTTLPEAIRLAAQRHVRHLPVVDGEDLVGIVSDRDLKRAMASPATSLAVHELHYLLDRVTVAELMTRTVITIGPAAPVEEAARLMVMEKVSALPVLEAGRLVGIVTETDVLTLFVRAMGAGVPSTRLDVCLGEHPSALSDVVRIIEQSGTSISSIVTLTAPGGLREVVIRVPTMNPRAAVFALQARGYRVRETWRG